MRKIKEAYIVGVSDAATVRPDLLAKWSKNNHKPLSAYLIGSAHKAEWDCGKGHVWIAPIRQEASRAVLCTECEKASAKKTKRTVKDLEKIYSPQNERPFSDKLPTHKSFLWICPNHPEPYSMDIKRLLNGIGCSYCAGRKILPNYNDFLTLFPYLRDFWSQKNTVNPETLGRRSTYKAVWCCSKNHEWETAVNVQILKDKERLCPYCSEDRVLIGETDAATTSPELIPQWHPSKNGSATLSQFFDNNAIRKFWWWNPECKHEWEEPIYRRKERINDPCPVCDRRIFQPNVNDLPAYKPYVRDMWDYELNNRNPDGIGPDSHRKVWLKCTNGFPHSFAVLASAIHEDTSCLVCANKQVWLGFNDLATTNPAEAKQFHPTKNGKVTPESIVFGTHKRLWWICEKNHEWDVRGIDRKNYSTGCPECRQQTSAAEKEIAEWIRSVYDGEIETNVYNIIPGRRELDIYLPSEGLAIEFNGIYWHSEKYRGEQTHYKKWLDCKDRGIQLIQIWEDVWSDKPELVKAMLANKIGLRTQKTIYGRKTTPSEITSEEAVNFLEKNHIQGGTVATHYIGLRTNTGEIVAVMLLTKTEASGEVLNIVRYATSCNVPGGFTKLLNYSEKNHHPKKYITFSDHTVSDGKLYKDNGFILDKEISPDYMYVVAGKRQHKFAYRLKRFKNDPALKYEEGMTEKQLAKLNNLSRIWDAGKTRWVKTVNPS